MAHEEVFPFVNSHQPITTDDSEPEPDITLLKGTELDYLKHHPRPEDVALVIEVSDTTLSQDRTIKKRLYAAAAIPVYWLVNLPDNQIELYTHPLNTVSGPDYGQRHTYSLNDAVPVTIAGETTGSIPATELLPS